MSARIIQTCVFHILTVVDVVEESVRIQGIINCGIGVQYRHLQAKGGKFTNKWTAETIAVLRRQMRVVPIRASLIRNLEVVQEGVTGGDRTLSDERRSVGPVSVLLEKTVPVLISRHRFSIIQ
jgi:hypothetical protein